jgi:hypothetical protein
MVVAGLCGMQSDDVNLASSPMCRGMCIQIGYIQMSARKLITGKYGQVSAQVPLHSE